MEHMQSSLKVMSNGKHLSSFILIKCFYILIFHDYITDHFIVFIFTEAAKFWDSGLMMKCK